MRVSVIFMSGLFHIAVTLVDAAAVRIGPGNGRDQRLGIGMGRGGDDLLGLADLDQLPRYMTATRSHM